MNGIAIPKDRTTSQPARGYCVNPACVEDATAGRFEFNVENDQFVCPKCGADSQPTVGLLVLIHLVVKHPEGKLVGSGGNRYNLACDADRAYIATVTNMEAGSGDPAAVNCPGCLAAMPDDPGWKFTGNIITPE